MKPGSQKTNLVNVLRHAASNPRNAAVMFRKIAKRFNGTGRYSPEDNARWIDAHKILPSDYAAARHPELWQEAVAFGEALRARARLILADVPFDMGAGGDYEFLYWLTRHLKPITVIETGVSAGWSSQAFLAALEKNGAGRLYSSDFPLFRVRDPVRYIGILVEESLKHRWELHTDGDEYALPRIVNSVSSVDLFHYDSDKSISGRRTAYFLVKPRLKGPMLVDDILNDSWFRELVEEEGLPFTIMMNATQHCFGMIDP